MTTKVMIISPNNNHLNVQVEVIGDGGVVRATYRLDDGQLAELWVFDNQQLRISEVARLPKVTP